MGKIVIGALIFLIILILLIHSIFFRKEDFYIQCSKQGKDNKYKRKQKEVSKYLDTKSNSIQPYTNTSSADKLFRIIEDDKNGTQILSHDKCNQYQKKDKSDKTNKKWEISKNSVNLVNCEGSSESTPLGTYSTNSMIKEGNINCIACPYENVSDYNKDIFSVMNNTNSACKYRYSKNFIFNKENNLGPGWNNNEKYADNCVVINNSNNSECEDFERQSIASLSLNKNDPYYWYNLGDTINEQSNEKCKNISVGGASYIIHQTPDPIDNATLCGPKTNTPPIYTDIQLAFEDSPDEYWKKISNNYWYLKQDPGPSPGPSPSPSPSPGPGPGPSPSPSPSPEPSTGKYKVSRLLPDGECQDIYSSKLYQNITKNNANCTTNFCIPEIN